MSNIPNTECNRFYIGFHTYQFRSHSDHLTLYIQSKQLVSYLSFSNPLVFGYNPNIFCCNIIDATLYRLSYINLLYWRVYFSIKNKWNSLLHLIHVLDYVSLGDNHMYGLCPFMGYGVIINTVSGG